MQHSNIQHITNKSGFQRPKLTNDFIIHSQLNTIEKKDSRSALSVKLVLQGTERYQLNNKRYDLSAGDFMIVDQDQELNISFNEDEVAEGMCFYFNRKYIEQLFALSKFGDSWGFDYILLSKKDNRWIIDKVLWQSYNPEEQKNYFIKLKSLSE